MSIKYYEIVGTQILALRYLLHFLMLKKEVLSLTYPRISGLKLSNTLVLLDPKNQHLHDTYTLTDSSVLLYNVPHLASLVEAKCLNAADLPEVLEGNHAAFSSWLKRFGFEDASPINFISPDHLLMESKKLFFVVDKKQFKFPSLKEDPLQTLIKAIFKKNIKVAALSLVENEVYYREEIFPILSYLIKVFKNKAMSDRDMPGWTREELREFSQIFSRLNSLYRKINIDYYEHFLSIIILSLDSEHVSLDKHLYLEEPFDTL